MMVPAFLTDEVGSIPVRRLSNAKLPGMERQETMLRVSCPKILAGDDTAFAFYMHDKSLMPVIRQGALMYCSRRRDPGPGDLALLSVKKDGWLVRVLTDIHEDGFETLRLQMGEDWSVQSVRDLIPFEELDEIALVMMTSKFTV